MTRDKLKGLLTLVFVIAGICCYKSQPPGYNSNNSNNSTTNTVANTAETTFPACPASADWVNNPQSGPAEVPQGNAAQLCQFYQFSWQWFLAMMNQTPGGDTRNYQNQQQYPQWQLAGNSCTATNAKPALFVRTDKNKDNKLGDFVLPERIGQAGGGNIIYDKNGNVVLYEVRFSRNECAAAEANPQPTNFQPGTIELKIAYREITPAEVNNYVVYPADINGDGVNELLGMVGFHLVISTPDHPEFIWATFEHKQNAPECQIPPAPSDPAWSFTSAQCAAQLPNSVNPSQCDFNLDPTPTPTPALSGNAPTQICRVYHDGSKPGDDKFGMNVFDIDTLNAQVTGPNGIVTGISQGPLAVLKNYQMVGALWVNQDSTSPSFPNPSGSPVPTGNQRGSVQLANATMETTFQQGFGTPPYTGTGNLQPAANCFACHGFDPQAGNVQQSHIFDDILAQTKKK